MFTKKTQIKKAIIPKIDDITLPIEEEFEIYSKYSIINHEHLINYIKLLQPIELKALRIAKNSLNTSFNIELSNGFKEYLDKNEIN